MTSRVPGMATMLVIGGLLAAPALAAEEAETAGYVIIVNPVHAGARVARADLELIFLGNPGQWGDQTEIIPIDLSLQSPARRAFCRDVLQRSPGAVADYWLKIRRLRHRGIEPPLVLGSESEVLAFVASTPGAIGYLSDATAVDGSVQVLKLPDE